METKDAVFEKLSDTLVELFELDKSAITLDSKLYEDLDIDSIDAVDLVVKLKQITGKRIEPSDFKNVRTVQDVVDAIHELVTNDDVPPSS